MGYLSVFIVFFIIGLACGAAIAGIIWKKNKGADKCRYEFTSSSMRRLSADDEILSLGRQDRSSDEFH